MPKKARSDKAPRAGVPEGESPPAAATEATSPGASFEDAFSIVEGAVEELERGNLPLEESLREYERGLRALRSCYEILGGAQKRIEVLSSELGTVAGDVWRPAATDAALTETIDSLDDLATE